MAATKSQGKISIDVDPVALKDLRATLRLLDKETSSELRDKAQDFESRLNNASSAEEILSILRSQE